MKKSLIMVSSILIALAAVIVTLSLFRTYRVTGIDERYPGEYTITLCPDNKYTADIANFPSSGSYAALSNFDGTIDYIFYDADGNTAFKATKIGANLIIGDMNFIKTSLF